jgi:sugar phosphate permease
MPPPPRQTSPPAAHGALAVVAVLCLGYLLSQFFRTSVGVIGPELMRSLGLSAAALGTLGGTYFLAFAAAQIPIGVALDRFGPRRVNASLLLVAALGAAVFALAPDAATLTLGRALMGVGCAAALMGSLVVFARWFPPRRFSTMAGLMLALGGLGALISTAPLAVAAEALGWRGAILGAGAATVAVAALIWLVVRDAPPGRGTPACARETMPEALSGVATVLRNRDLHRLLPLNAVSYASVISVLGLWGAPYLADVHGLAVVDAGKVLMAMAVMLMAGSIGYGWLAPRLGSYKRPALAGAGGLAAIYALLALGLPAGIGAVAVLIALAGMVGAYSVLLISHVRGLFPDHMVGRGLTAANLFNFGGVGLVQAATGWIVEAWPAAAGARPPAAYSAVFWFLAAIVALAALVYARARDPLSGAGR